MKEYCFDCLDVFELEALEYCICDSWASSDKKTIVTKYGVKNEEVKRKYCKNCLEIRHTHEGEMFI